MRPNFCFECRYFPGKSWRSYALCPMKGAILSGESSAFFCQEGECKDSPDPGDYKGPEGDGCRGFFINRGREEALVW